MVISVACQAALAEVLNILTLVIYNRFESEEAVSVLSRPHFFVLSTADDHAISSEFLLELR